jgi:hypothetical protein
MSMAALSICVDTELSIPFSLSIIQFIYSSSTIPFNYQLPLEGCGGVPVSNGRQNDIGQLWPNLFSSIF